MPQLLSDLSFLNQAVLSHTPGPENSTTSLPHEIIASAPSGSGTFPSSYPRPLSPLPPLGFCL